MKKNNFRILIISLVFFIGCNNVEDIPKKAANDYCECFDQLKMAYPDSISYLDYDISGCLAELKKKYRMINIYLSKDEDSNSLFKDKKSERIARDSMVIFLLEMDNEKREICPDIPTF